MLEVPGCRLLKLLSVAFLGGVLVVLAAAPALAGTNEWTSTPILGGYVARFESPGFATTSTVYAAMGTDGVRTLPDTTQAWSTVGSGLDGLFVNDVTWIGSATLLAGTRAGVYRLESGESTWTSTAVGIDVSAVEALPNGTAILGKAAGGVLFSTNDGLIWSDPTTDVPAPVVSLATSVDGTAVAGTDGGGVWASTDGGDSWVSRSDGLVGTAVRAIAFGSDGAWYAATDAGIAKSTNAGGQWIMIRVGDFDDVLVADEYNLVCAQRGVGLISLSTSGLSSYGQVTSLMPSRFPRTLAKSGWALLAGYPNLGVYRYWGAPWGDYVTATPRPQNQGLVPLTVTTLGYAYNWAAIGVAYGSNPGGLIGETGGDVLQFGDEYVYQAIQRRTGDVVAGTDKGVYRGTTRLAVPDGQPELDAHSVGMSADETTIVAGIHGAVMAYNNGWTALPVVGLPDEWIGAVTASCGGGVVAGTSSGLLVLDAGASAWRAVPGVTGPVRAATSLADGTLLVAEPSAILASSDDGKTWATLSAPGSDVRSLWAMRDGSVYAAVYEGGAFKSSDDGQTWQRVGGALSGVRQVVASPIEPNLTALTEDGLQSITLVQPYTSVSPADGDGIGFPGDKWYRYVPTVSLSSSLPGTIHWRWDSGEESSVETSRVSFAAPTGIHTLYCYSTTSVTTEPLDAHVFKVDPDAPTGDFSLDFDGYVPDGTPGYAAAQYLLRITPWGSDAGGGLRDVLLQIGEPSPFFFKSWQDLASASGQRAIDPVDGTTTVTVEFRDEAGNTFSRTHTITIDTQAPAGTASLSYLKRYGTSLYLAVRSSVPAVGTGVTQMRTNTGPGWSLWSAYANEKTVSMPATGGTKTVSVQYRDDAGHVLATNASYTYITPKPTVTKPTLSTAGPRSGAYFTLSGYISPKVGGSTRLYFYRRSGSAWVLSKAVKVTNTAVGSRSHYALRTRLFPRGSWFVRAYYSGSSYYRSASSLNSYFTVVR